MLLACGDDAASQVDGSADTRDAASARDAATVDPRSDAALARDASTTAADAALDAGSRAPCQDIVCGVKQECSLRPKACLQEPCLQLPVCVDTVDDCSACTADEACWVQDKVDIPSTLSCEPMDDSGWCQLDSCAYPKLCRLRPVQCIRAPCPYQPTCVDSVDSCDACGAGQACVQRPCPDKCVPRFVCETK